jgi:hypothetical protein
LAQDTKAKISELSELDQIIERFSKELADFIKGFIERL